MPKTSRHPFSLHTYCSSMPLAIFRLFRKKAAKFFPMADVGDEEKNRQEKERGENKNRI